MKRIIIYIVLFVNIVSFTSCRNNEENSYIEEYTTVEENLNYLSLDEGHGKEEKGYDAIFLSLPDKGEVSNIMYDCVCGNTSFCYIALQYNENYGVEYIPIDQNILDFNYALTFFEKDKAAIRTNTVFEKYAIVDLDGDENTELIFYVYQGGEGYYLILHNTTEVVYAYAIPSRGMMKVSTDGYVWASDGASYNSIYKITAFSEFGYEKTIIAEEEDIKYRLYGNEVLEEDYRMFCKEFQQKEEVFWK